MKSRYTLFMGLFFVMALALAACGGTVTQTVEPNDEQTAVGLEPSVSVLAQTIEGSTVEVAKVVSAEPGWIVIHAEADGKPGAVIGYSPVGEGTTENVDVEIDLAQATERLFAMLHVDGGQVGVYEFPGDDVPAKAGENIVNVAFEAMLPAPESAVRVGDQEVSDVVMIDEVISAEPGWIVIHIEAEGKPGPIIGMSAVKAGVNKDVQVAVDGTKATEVLYAMLHVDRGQAGVFEFPDGEDVPAQSAGQIVNVPFSAALLPATSKFATVELAQSSFGMILVDSQGMVLYLFTPDNAGESTCYDDCAINWPPLLVESTPVAGEGLDASLLGTTQRTDGSLQVTYAEWPLYYFISDISAGETKGQGVGGVWYVISAEGERVTTEGGADLPDY